jgi:hypothetical protein
MTFEKTDQVQVDNLIRALKKAKFEVEGLEVLALADVYRWVNHLKVKIDADLSFALAGPSVQISESLPTNKPIPQKTTKGK